jgi:hypothetical protein
MKPKTSDYILFGSYAAFCLLITFYFFPLQEKYYLDSDIKSIESNSFITVLQILFVLVAFLILYFRNSITVFANTIKIFLIVFFLFFSFQKSLTSITLFSNRFSEKSLSTKKYMVGHLVGSSLNKENFHLLDLESNNIITDEKLLSFVYNGKLKDRDTITVSFKLGFWKIKFL